MSLDVAAPQTSRTSSRDVSSMLSVSRASRSPKFEQIGICYGLFEMVAVCLCALAAARIYWSQTSYWNPDLTVMLVPSVLVALGIGLFGSASGGRIELVLAPGPAFLWSAVRTTTMTFAAVLALFFLLKISDSYSRGMLISQMGAVMVTILTLRSLFQTFVRRRLARGQLETDRVIVLGALAQDRTFLERLSTNGTRIIGAQTLDPDGTLEERLAFAKTVVTACRANDVDHVVIALSDENGGFARLIVEALAETPVTVNLVPQSVECPLFRSRSSGIGGLPSAVINNRPLNALDLTIKRAFDVVVSLVALVLLSPVLLAVAAAIRIDSKGPVFFRQTRHGYGNKAIRVFKFRSMRVLEDGKAFRQAKRNDPRITRVGRFIRKTNLDELPQLFNVLLGEMSIVGPRPHPIALNESFAEQIKWFSRRHNIRPGITGWAQINGYRGETETLQKMAGRVEHDLWYLDNWSFILDLKIMILTVFSPIAYRGAR